MRIELDRERCTGHGLCYSDAPQLFVPDDKGYSVPVLDGSIPTDLEPAARKSAESCPERAIAIVMEDR